MQLHKLQGAAVQVVEAGTWLGSIDLAALYLENINLIQ